MRVSRRGSRDFIQESLHVRDRVDPQNPIKFMFTKVGSCNTILFSKLIFSSMEIRQQWHLKTT